VQVIDVADLAAWLVTAAERGTSGVFNAVGDTTTIDEVLTGSAAAAGTGPAYREASHAWLAEHDVAPWSGPESLPLWLPQPDYAGFMTRSNRAAHEAGLELRPLADTLAATLRWEREQGLSRQRRAGLTQARERTLLAELT
jgi:hypothetical protein